MLITVVLSLVELHFTKNTTFHDLILYLVNSFPFPYYLFSQDLEIPFECTYPNQAEASLIQMNITNAKVIFLAPDDGSGMFDLDLNIYKVRIYKTLLVIWCPTGSCNFVVFEKFIRLI